MLGLCFLCLMFGCWILSREPLCAHWSAENVAAKNVVAENAIIQNTITENMSIKNGILKNTAGENLTGESSGIFESEIEARGSVLIEKSTGKILYESEANKRVPIASVTKLMTILLTLEHIEAGDISLDDQVKVSANASGMGGSQVFLDNGEEYALGELLKSVIIASANDSSVALAEHISGSESNFVRLMNERAAELGLKNTNYANCTGLPSAAGYSSAYDQAVVLSHVLDYETYHEYSGIWMEDFVHPSGRTTQMTNTNKLSRFYDGCVGGKTGSTNEAKYCLAVGAKRADMELISVVLGVDSTKNRFKLASDMLNFGFQNYEKKVLFSDQDLSGKQISIKGMNRKANLKAEREYTYVCEQGKMPIFSLAYALPDQLKSVKENQVVGYVEVIIDGVVVDKISILSADTYEEATLLDYIKQITNA